MMNRFKNKNWKPPVIKEGKLTKWNWMVQHKDNLVLGKRVDIGAFTYINAKNGVVLGDDVQIASHCAIYSTSTIDGKEGRVIMKKGSSIGSHTVVLPGVTIGENAIVGACSLVNADIPPNVIAFGVPAKVVRKRS